MVQNRLSQSISQLSPQLSSQQSLQSIPKGASRLSSSKTALVVEDELNISRLIKTWLEIKGFSVVVANNASEALEILDKKKKEMPSHPFNVITTDVVMPGMNGITFVNKVKSDPKTYKIPIVVLSIIDKNELGNFFADAYVKKPFDGFEFLKTVDDLM
jgi:CheY-like chemotaxis protein